MEISPIYRWFFPIEMNTGIVLRKWFVNSFNFPLDGIENSFNSGWTRRFPDFSICHVWLPEGSRGFFALDASEWQGPQTSLNGHDAWQIVPHRLNHASCPRLVEGHSILHYRICMYSIYIYIHIHLLPCLGVVLFGMSISKTYHSRGSWSFFCRAFKSWL